MLRAAAECKEGVDNLLKIYHKKVSQLSELNAKAKKTAADNRTIETLTQNILNLGAMLKSKNKLTAKEQKFLADLLMAHGPVQVIALGRGVSRRR